MSNRLETIVDLKKYPINDLNCNFYSRVQPICNQIYAINFNVGMLSFKSEWLSGHDGELIKSIGASNFGSNVSQSENPFFK